MYTMFVNILLSNKSHMIQHRLRRLKHVVLLSTEEANVSETTNHFAN